jgi:site-specific DNA recombinase
MQRNKEGKLNFRAIIYTRVSSKEQVEGTSLDTQKERCIAYCQQQELEIDRIFVEEGESAKVLDRTELQNMLAYCRKNKGKISHLIVYRFDRFARNMQDHLWLRKELAGLGITVKSVTDPTDDTVAGQLLENILASVYQFDNDLRRERCVNGMQKKIRAGIWPLQTPAGYMPFKKLASKEKKQIADIPHPENFDIVKKAFSLYLTEQYSIAELTRKINSLYPTFKIYPQKMQYILSNKFYCGILTDPWDGSEHSGLHGAMISKQEFDQVQQIMKGKGINYMPKRIINPDFPLKGTVRCGDCNNFYTGSWSTSRNKDKHAYYHCTKPGQHIHKRGVKKAVLEEDFLDYLSNITPKEEYLEDFWKTVIQISEKKFKEVNQEYARYEKQRDELENYRKGLVKQNALGILPDEDFKKELPEIKRKIEMIELAMNDSKMDIFREEAVLAYSKHFVYNLPRQWFDLGIEGKRRFQKLLFPEGLPYLGNKKFGTAKLCVVFEINQEFQKGKTNMVGPVGFEPTTKRLCFSLLLSQLLSNL